MARVLRPVPIINRPGRLRPPPPPPPGGVLPGRRFEELPLEEQLTLATSYQTELKSRPPSRRGEGAKSTAGGDCTRYFKQTDPRTGKTIWKVLTGQPCGPDARPAPTPRPLPTPTPRPVPTPRRVCDRNDEIRRHIEGLLQSGADVYGGLAMWKSTGLQIIATELPVCADIAREFTAAAVELQNRPPSPGLGVSAVVPAAIQMYLAAARKSRRELWSDQWSLPI